MACDTPYLVDNPTYPYDLSGDRKVPVPCGRCPVCLRRRVNQWVFRLQQEYKICDSANFVTLTYDTDNIPISSLGYMNLCKKDVQLFLKRCRTYITRDLCEKPKVRYYACGEYGSNYKRPHYHLILFNVPEAIIRKAWTAGGIHLGSVAGASIAYTLKYINKGKVVPEFVGDDRQPEFSLMSKGLGKNYLTNAAMRYHKNDLSRNYVVMPGGQKVALPRYYRDKIYTEHEKFIQVRLLKEAISLKAEKDEINFNHSYGDLPDYSYDMFVESERIGRYNAYSDQRDKKRKDV